MAEEKKSKAMAYLFILRWTVAFIFLIHGFQKFSDPAFGKDADEFFRTLQDDIIFGPYKGFFKNIILPNASLFAMLVKYGELGVGAAFLIGLPLRLAATGGIFMNLNYLFIASSPSLIFLNILMIVCQFVIVGTHRD